jgi:CHAT domain-containing protein/Tfp pilus assembly protein PilF/predicted negative regulator of RcsB-dependent stress response
MRIFVPTFILLFFCLVNLAAQQKEGVLASQYNSLADSLSQVPDYRIAILYRKKALNIYQNQKPVPFDLVVMEYRSIGIYYRRLGKIEESEYYQRRAVELAEQWLDAKNPELAKAYNSFGLFFLTQGNYDQALIYLDKSLVINKKIKSSDVADNLNNIGIVYENQGAYSKAREFYAKAKSVNLTRNGLWNLKTADNFINMGTASHQLGEYDLALAFFDTSLMIHDSLLPVNHPFYTSLYNNIGAVYNVRGDNREAIKYFDKALTCYQSNNGVNTAEIANIYANIGILLLDRGDLDKALLYFQRAYHIRTEIYGQNHPLVARTCNYIGDCFLQKKNLETAFNWFAMALEIFLRLPGGDPADLSEYKSDMGLYFEKLGNKQEALVYFNQALDLLNQREETNSPAVANLLDRMGNVYLENGESETAQYYFRQSLNIYLNSFGTKHPEVARSYARLGSACFPDEVCAMEYCDSAYSAINYKLTGSDSFQEVGSKQLTNNKQSRSEFETNNEQRTSFQEVVSPITLLSILHTQGNLLYRFYEQSNQESTLQKADQVYQIATRLIDFIKMTLEEPGSRQSLLDNFFLIYEQAILIKYQLQETSQDKKYWHEAFELSERSSSILLLEALQSIDAEQFAGIPDSLLKMERNLKIDLAFYEKEHFEEELKGGGADSKRMNLLSDKIFDLEGSYTKLMDNFRKNYPAYFSLKYAPAVVKVDEIQRKLLRPGQTMLNYFVGENQLFVFLISKDQCEVRTIQKDFPLEIWVEEFRNSIYRYNPLSKELEYLNQKYTNIGYELYQLIFEPVKSLLKNKDLVIIPGGVLGYLPFEALLSVQVDDYNDFDDNPYLIKDYQFSYCYSATLLKEMTRKRDGWRRGGFIAFAPSYSGDSLTLRSDPWRAILGQLRFNITESLAIQRIMGGRVFKGSAASEANFRRFAPKSGILHLAAHAKANDEYGDYSYLAFYQTLDSVENELIFVKDLYTMRIRAALVVLSACETGVGELQRGEGIVSLARGFSYAGAASIVTTMWSIDDNASAEIMEAFYRNLKNGGSKDKALRDAKLAFLTRKRGTNATHPLYWAAFVPVGDMSPLGQTDWWKWLLLPFIMLCLLFGWKRRSFQSRKA